MSRVNSPPAQHIAGDRRTHVLDCAERLVAVRGFDRVRLRDVATEAGVSIGSLQHLFETRDQLLRETFRHSASRRVERWLQAATVDGDPWDRLAGLLAAAMDERAFRARSAIWLEFASAASRDEELRRVMATLYDAWRVPMRRAIADGVAAGTLAPVIDVDSIVDLLATQIDGMEIAVTIEASGMEFPRLAELVLDSARMMLGMRPTD
jgi:AcrR family transcriptional regulator